MGRAQAEEFIAGRSEEYRGALSIGQALALSGQAAEAQRFLAPVAKHLEAALRQAPDDHFSMATLAQVQAALGQKEQALDSAARAAERVAPQPGRRPRSAYYLLTMNLAQIEAESGRAQQALDHLAWLLKEPSDVHAHAVLRDPLWLPLGRSAEFQKLVKAALPD